MGYLLEQEGQVVGFLGAIYSQRMVRGKSELFCNLTNWCVLPNFRNESLRLLFAIHGQAGQTIINLSPSDEVQRMLGAMRYRPLDTFKLFTLPLLQPWTLTGTGKLIWGQSRMEQHLDESGRKIVRDHLGTGCRFLLIIQNGETCLVVSKKRHKRQLTFTEILHAGNSALLRKNFERVKLGLLFRDRTPLLAIDERLLKSRLPLMLPYRRASFLKSAHALPEDVDNLYSEIAVL